MSGIEIPSNDNLLTRGMQPVTQREQVGVKVELIVQAFLADYIGNLYYALTARNFNPVMAMAADTVIVEADNIVPVGVIAPDHVVTPAPVVDYIISHA
jgi:hypothetical protein